MKKIMVLGAGEMQVPVIQKARQMNVLSVVADCDENAPGLAYADKKLIVSTLDYSSLLKHARKEKIDGILTTSDYPVNVVAGISNALGLYSMEMRVAEICTNKYLQRILFKERGINTPFFKLCERLEDLENLVCFPYIVKPVDSSASRGVQRVDNSESLKSSFLQARAYSRTKKVLVESFISGREFSVETYTQHGITTVITVTEKLLIGEKYGAFVEDTHIEPACLQKEEYDLICAEVLKVIAEIGLDNCPSHTEIKLNSEGAFVIEIACRLGGDYITSDLVPLSTGIDMLENLIRVSLGEEIDVIPKWNKFSCVQFLNPQNYQRCMDFIRTGSGEIVRYEKKSYENLIIKNSLDRLGYIILQTDTREKLERILGKIK